jgi:hypothetical protein
MVPPDPLLLPPPLLQETVSIAKSPSNNKMLDIDYQSPPRLFV